MAIDDNDTVEAENALTFIKRHARDASAIARECRFAIARRDHASALQLFGELCRCGQGDRDWLDWVVKPLAKVVGDAEVNRVLRTCVMEPDTGRTAVARLLVDRVVQKLLRAKGNGLSGSFCRAAENSPTGWPRRGSADLGRS